MRTLGQKEFMDGVHEFIENDFPRKDYISLQGYPGTGKTYIITKIVEEFTELNILYIAYTGKAVDNLMAKGVKCDTISSAFYKVRKDTQELEFELKSCNELDDKWDVVIIDEFSQLNQSMVNDLLSFGIKFIFVGDYGQIGPVKGNSTSYLRNADYILEEIVRQKEDSGILKLSREFRKTRKLPAYGKYTKDVILIPRNRVSSEIILKSDQCICGTNATRDKWNNIIRKARKRVDYLPEPGERLISIKNMKHVQVDGRMIINGTTGTCVSTKDTPNGYFIMQFKPDWSDKSVVLRVDKSDFLGKKPSQDMNLARFEWGYVITVNKAQGSEWDNVLFIVDKNMPAEALVENINTGITRAKKKLAIAYDS